MHIRIHCSWASLATGHAFSLYSQVRAQARQTHHKTLGALTLACSGSMLWFLSYPDPHHIAKGWHSSLSSF